MNKKIIVFGCILAVFLMLMISVRPAVEAQNKNIKMYNSKLLTYYINLGIINWLLWLRDIFISIVWYIFWVDFDWSH